MVDLAKAFHKVPHWVLVREGRRLNYPMWMMKLSISTYRMARVLRKGQTISGSIMASRGITAGSGLATTEMRVVLIDAIDRALEVSPRAWPTVFVDDMSAEAGGPQRFVVGAVVSFSGSLCRRLKEDQMEVSTKKSVCTASHSTRAEAIEQGLVEHGIKRTAYVRSFGVGLEAEIRRNTQVMRVRTTAFRKRLPAFNRLKAAGYSTTRVLRTGGTAGLTWGQICGIADGPLLEQRRLVAAAAAWGDSIMGQQLDMALVLADGQKGKADPAYEAHYTPIVMWAKAVYNHWVPVGALQAAIERAKPRLAAADNLWLSVRGPVAAMVATAGRLGWQVDSATRVIDFTADSPAVVKDLVTRAVRTWRRAEVRQASAEYDGRLYCKGPRMQPIWKLLNGRWSKEEGQAKDPGMLKSAMCKGQWPQVRCEEAGFSRAQ